MSQAWDEESSGMVSEEEAAPELYFNNVNEFVQQFLARVYRRHVGQQKQFRWSRQWWDSPEAMVRLDALWRAWESLRHDPAFGSSAWLRDHADHHMPILLSPDGPFGKSEDSNSFGDPLPCDDPPEGLFEDVTHL